MSHLSLFFLCVIGLVVLYSARADIKTFIRDIYNSSPRVSLSIQDLEKSLEVYTSATKKAPQGLFVLPTLPHAKPVSVPAIAEDRAAVEPDVGPVMAIEAQVDSVEAPMESAYAAQYADDDVEVLVEPPEDWELMAQYQGRPIAIDYSETDRYSIEDANNGARPTLVSEEYFDEERGFFQAAVYEDETSHA